MRRPTAASRKTVGGYSTTKIQRRSSERRQRVLLPLWRELRGRSVERRFYGSSLGLFVQPMLDRQYQYDPNGRILRNRRQRLRQLQLVLHLRGLSTSARIRYRWRYGY